MSGLLPTTVGAATTVLAVLWVLRRAWAVARAARASNRLRAAVPAGAPRPGLHGSDPRGRRGGRGRGRRPTPFEVWVADHPLPPPIRRRVVGVGLAWSPELVVTAVVLAVVLATVTVVLVAGTATAMLVAACSLVAAVAAIALGAGRADRAVDRDLPAALDRVSAALRAGASLPAAVMDATDVARGPLRADLEQVRARLTAGDTVSEAVDGWRRARPTAAVGTTAAALAIAHRVGGGAARAVDGVAASLRDRASVQREVIALSTQARASAVVIVVAPLGFGLVTGAADHQTWRFLTGTPLGWVCLAGGLLLDVVGGLWMAWLARSVGRS